MRPSPMKFRTGASRLNRARQPPARKLSAAERAGTEKPSDPKATVPMLGKTLCLLAESVRKPGNRTRGPFRQRGLKGGPRPQTLEVARHAHERGERDEPARKMQAVANADVGGTESGSQKIVAIAELRLQHLHGFFQA